LNPTPDPRRPLSMGTRTPDTILLTGFEPFDQWSANPSWEIARHLNGQVIGGLRVVARMLPVDWERTWPVLRDAISETRPGSVLMLGLASRRSCISVESRGLNMCDGKPDNAGNVAPTQAIDSGGSEELLCTVPVELMVSSIQGLGLPVEKSESAGGYLCNYALYKALAWAKTEPDPPPIGFIHVPNLPDASPEFAGMDLADMIKSVRSAITAIAESSKSNLFSLTSDI